MTYSYVWVGPEENVLVVPSKMDRRTESEPLAANQKRREMNRSDAQSFCDVLYEKGWDLDDEISYVTIGLWPNGWSSECDDV